MEHKGIVLCFLLTFQNVLVMSLNETVAMTQQCSTSVRWSHATNSRDKLIDALSSNTVDFIEADVLLGTVTEANNGARIPVMAHPPNRTSDISFNDWIRIVNESDNTKGIKIDFKQFDIVEICLAEVSRITSTKSLRNALWLNADVLVGPGQPDTPMPLPAEGFVDVCRRKGPPRYVLSIGWTTKEPCKQTEFHGEYTWKHVFEMIELLDKVPASTVVTFPVRLSYLSFNPLSLLLSVKHVSSLTVWSSEKDALPRYDVMGQLMRAYPQRIYADLPEARALRVSAIHENIARVIPPITLTIVSWDQTGTSDHSRLQGKPWGSQFAIVIPGPGKINVHVAEPHRLKWVRVNGSLNMTDMKRLSEEPTRPSCITLNFVGTGKAVVFLEQPVTDVSE